jgi:hypothetical protein
VDSRVRRITGASSGKCCWFSAASQHVISPGFQSFVLSSNLHEDQKKQISLLSQLRLLFQRTVWQSAEDSGYASPIGHEKAFFSGGFHGLLFILLYCSCRKILQA